jgi:large subunit ribosomal protein L28
MSRICKICGKRPQIANIVSHANNKVKKWVYPNVHKMRFKLANSSDGKVHCAKVCTKCVKAQKIVKII